jgi:6-pyruvoyl-tetrahydropterin synthase related domain
MRRFVPPLLVSLFALFAAQPLFVDQLTCSDDSAFHIGRAVNLEALIRAGHFFPRWSPYMAHGFGYPFFNYYAPLSSYVLVLIHNLGFIYPNALYIAFGISLWLAGLATYALARDWFGEAAGVAAAVVYLSAPYFAYDILFRGNLAESFALIFPPLILFALHRALRPVATGTPLRASLFTRWLFLAALAFAGLLYTHNATALAAAPLFAAYVALLAFTQRDWRVLIRGGLSLVFGLALSANFWLPALLETNLVQTDKLLVPPIFTYYTNYISVSELLAPPIVIDPLLINPSPAKALGLVTAILALLGLGAIVYRATRPPNKGQSNPALAFGQWLLAAGLFYCFLTLAISQPLWDVLPLIKFIQFPWRFLSLAMLCAALLAGAVVSWVPKRAWWLAGAVILAALIGNLSWWYPRYCVPFQETTLASTIRYELDTATLGTTAKGEYLPRTVTSVPDDDSLAQALIKGEQPQYLSGLANDSTLTVTQADPLDYQATFDLKSETQLTFNQFFFPGWAATLDNQTLAIAPATNSGLITFTAPAGAHNLHIYFGNTPLHLTSALISISALLAALLYGLWWWRTRVPALSPTLDASPPTPSAPLAFFLLPILCLLVRPLIIDRISNPLRHSAFDGQSVSIGQPLNVNLAGGLTVLSVEYPASVPSGGDFDISAYLTAREPVANAYRPRFDLSDNGAFIWNNGNEALPPRWHKEPPETDSWPVGSYAQWSRRETILPGTPPGDYALTATIFDRATLQPDSVVDENGVPVSPVTPLGTIHVTRPSTPPNVDALNIQYPANYDFGPLTLLGYNLDRTEAQPGDRVLITLFFRADEAMPIEHTFNLFTPSYPTNEWQVGDVWRFQTWGSVPVDRETGPYHFQLAPLTLQAEPFDMLPIHITAPERVFTAPAIANAASTNFGDLIELAGYDIVDRDSLTITLLWKALATPNADFSAFIHIEDANGQIVAQSDTVPLNGGRPTTSWLKGEYVLDPHSLPKLPSGEYSIYVGLASRPGGTRLPTPQGDRALIGVYKVP